MKENTPTQAYTDWKPSPHTEAACMTRIKRSTQHHCIDTCAQQSINRTPPPQHSLREWSEGREKTEWREGREKTWSNLDEWRGKSTIIQYACMQQLISTCFHNNPKWCQGGNWGRDLVLCLNFKAYLTTQTHTTLFYKTVATNDTSCTGCIQMEKKKTCTNNLHFPFFAETRFSFEQSIKKKNKWKMHIVEFSSLVDE